MREIYLAGGCFWGTEAYFKAIKGVTYTSVGYANGDTASTNYQEIKQTGHAEVVYIKYDPKVVGLNFLLEMYYKVIDPLSVNKQGEDVGAQYRTGIYYANANDLPVIKASITRLERDLGETVAIEIAEVHNYVDAEDYHQDYLDKNPNGYCHIGTHHFEDAQNTFPS